MNISPKDLKMNKKCLECPLYATKSLKCLQCGGTGCLFKCTCGTYLCLSCLLETYNQASKHQGPMQLFGYSNVSVCPQCHTYFEEGMIYYLYQHPEDKGLFVSIRLQYCLWGDLIKQFITNDISKEDLLTKTGLKYQMRTQYPSYLGDTLNKDKQAATKLLKQRLSYWT